MSDILIKGMEMPTNCGKCKLKNAIECNRWKLVRSVALDRHKDCPLVPVHTPHGRLIDADALVDSFDPSDFWNPDAEDNCFAAIHVVNTAPTIIPAEEGE